MEQRDIRDEFIRRVAAGKSFVDVGGLWGVVSEKISIAHQAGASSVTMMDMALPNDPDWQGLSERMAQMGVPYETIIGDFLSYTSKPYDVVHSSGMLYHMVNPLDYLKRLRTITNEYAIITSVITQEVIENDAGVFQIPPSGVIFTLALTEQERAVLRNYWQPLGTVLGITEPREFSLESGGWLWVPTAAAFKSMVEACRFTIMDEGTVWMGNCCTVLVR